MAYEAIKCRCGYLSCNSWQVRGVAAEAKFNERQARAVAAALSDVDSEVSTTPLQRLIDLWRGIERLHRESFEARCTTRSGNLRADAAQVVRALMFYRTRLEGDS